MEDDLKKIQARHDEIERLLQDISVIQNTDEYQKLIKEYNRLSRIVGLRQELETVNKALADIKKTFEEEIDAEMKEIAKEEISELEKRRVDLLHHIEDELTPPDPMADRDIIV